MSPLAWHRSLFEGLLARRDRLPHALLFRGPEGAGKLAFSEALAQALLCERPGPAGEACDACPGCTWLVQGNHPDFRRLEPEKPEEPEGPGEGRDAKAGIHIDIGQVRALTGFINLSTHRGGARVVIMHPAETLNAPAANALLKSLEEPPPRTHFLLVSHRWHYLLPTLRSRCQQIALPLPSRAPALEWLASQGVAQPELALAHAGGAPLLAAKYDEEYWRLRDRLMELLGGAQFDPLGTGEELKDGTPAAVVAVLQKWSYDLASRKSVGIVRYNPDHSDALAALAERLDRLEILRFHRRMVRLQRVVRHPLNARLFLEDLFLSCAGLLRGTVTARAA